MIKLRGFEIVKGFENNNINIPKRSTKYSAAYDIESAEDVVLPSFKNGGGIIYIKTGLKAYMQDDEMLLLLPRSSGPKKLGIMFPHSMGVVDADYYGNLDNDGHILIQCINIKDEDIYIKKGDTVAQAIFQKYLIVDDDNAIGVRNGGFGSTDEKNNSN